jgi:hypothetical protein
MKRSNTILPVAIAMIICTFLPANAQDCYRGRPSPKCKTFWITEFGYSFRLDQQPGRYPSDANFYFTWEYGLMGNLNQKSALGAAFMLGADDDGHRYGVKSRYRRWLDKTVSVDLGAGVLFGGENNQFNPRFPGMTSHIGLNFGDWLALTTHVEIIRLEIAPFERPQTRTTKTDVAWYAGAKLGSYPGLIASIVGPVIALIIISQSDFGWN